MGSMGYLDMFITFSLSPCAQDLQSVLVCSAPSGTILWGLRAPGRVILHSVWSAAGETCPSPTWFVPLLLLTGPSQGDGGTDKGTTGERVNEQEEEGGSGKRNQGNRKRKEETESGRRKQKEEGGNRKRKEGTERGRKQKGRKQK
ncbi:unnamed protein product [Arctogadus glacialis]